MAITTTTTLALMDAEDFGIWCYSTKHRVVVNGQLLAPVDLRKFRWSDDEVSVYLMADPDRFRKLHMDHLHSHPLLHSCDLEHTSRSTSSQCGIKASLI